jgi:phage terminase large subunit-like protein
MFKRYQGDPREVSRSAREIIMSVDCANEEGASACWSVIHVFGLFSTPDGDRLRLLDEERGQWELPDLLAGYDRVCRRWPRAVKRLVEYAANGIALCQLRSGTIRVNPKGDKDYPGGSKEQRAEYTLTALQSGLGPEVPEDQWAPWADAFIEEHVSFPTGDNKDRVDTTSQVCIRVLVKTPLSEVWGQIAEEALRGKRSAA